MENVISKPNRKHFAYNIFAYFNEHFRGGYAMEQQLVVREEDKYTCDRGTRVVCVIKTPRAFRERFGCCIFCSNETDIDNQTEKGS